MLNRIGKKLDGHESFDVSVRFDDNVCILWFSKALKYRKNKIRPTIINDKKNSPSDKSKSHGLNDWAINCLFRY